jgi:hypothetical protein
MFSPWVPTLRVCLQRGELVLEDHLGFVEQAADQRGLAVVHLPQVMKRSMRLVLMLLEIGVDVLGDVGDEVGDPVAHQK